MGTYKVSIDTKYWKPTYINGKVFFERTDEPCHLYLQKTKPFLFDNSICNYKDANGRKPLYAVQDAGVRLRGHNDYIFFEPSGIMVPESNIELVKDKREIRDNPGLNADLNFKTYICDLISNTTRGGKESITGDEFDKYKLGLVNQTGNLNNPAFLSTFEFAYYYSYMCHKKGIDSINSYKLLSDIIEKFGSNPNYMPLLYNIYWINGEHEYKSEDLFKAFALLRYIGLIHPNYFSKYFYEDFVIDENMDRFPQLFVGKKDYLPLMEKFVKEQTKQPKK